MDTFEGLQVPVNNLFCYECSTYFTTSSAFKFHDHGRHLNRETFNTRSAESIIYQSESIVIKQENSEQEEEVLSSERECLEDIPRKKRKITKLASSQPELQNENAPNIKSKSNRLKTKVSSENENPNNKSKRKYCTKRSENVVKSKKTILKPSTLINLKELEDYLHCVKCFSTFYKLPALISHFKKCQKPKQNCTLKNFKKDKINPKFSLTSTLDSDNNKVSEIKSDNDHQPILTSTDPQNEPVQIKITEKGQESSSSSPGQPEPKLKAEEKEDETKFADSDSDFNYDHENDQNSSVDSNSDSDFDHKVKNVKVNNGTSEKNIEPEDLVPLSCTICKKQFKYKKSFEQHPKFCRGNNSRLSRLGQEKNFYRTHLPGDSDKGRGQGQPDSVFACPEENCPFSNRLWSVFKRHRRACHKPQVKCPEVNCPFSCIQRRQLRNHLYTLHNILITDLSKKVKEALIISGFEPPAESAGKNKVDRVKNMTKKVPGHSDEANNASKIETLLKSGTGTGKDEHGNFLCSVCGRSCSSKSSLNVHLRIHDDYRPYKCTHDGCSKAFAFARRLRDHIEVKHMDKVANNYKCDQEGCLEAFANRFKRQEHLFLVHGVVLFKCKFCNEPFKSSAAQAKHVLKFHVGRRFKCTEESCEKSFLTSQDLKWHTASIHGGEKEFKCTMDGCDKSFVRKTCFEDHIRTVHQNIRPFLCTYCGKGFRSAHNLERHVRVHTNEKPFVCDQCGRGFANTTTLRNHALIHSDEKPLQCRFCDKRFRISRVLSRHEQTHTKVLPYSCKFCEQKFPDNRPLKKHVLSQHTEDEFEFDINVPSTYQG